MKLKYGAIVLFILCGFCQTDVISEHPIAGCIGVDMERWRRAAHRTHLIRGGAGEMESWRGDMEWNMDLDQVWSRHTS